MAIDPNVTDFDVEVILSQYKNVVCNCFSKVRLLQFIEQVQSEKELVDIDEIYVDLMCEPYSIRGTGLFAEGKKGNCLQTLVLSENDKERHNKLNMVILGLPGAGKTTLLKFLLKRYCQQKRVVPLFIELKSEVDTEFSEVLEKESKVVFNDLHTYIANYFTARIGEDGAKLVDEIVQKRYSEKYEFIFFCDGLDEI